MKKLLISIQLFVTLFALSINTASAQLNTLILKQGNYQTEVNPKGCTCGMGIFDCICGIAKFHNYNSVSEIHLPKGQIYIVISSQAIVENTLQLKFKDRLAMKLKSNDFIQKEEVSLDSTSSFSLGYDSVTILPGKYTFKSDNSLTVNIRLSKSYDCHCFGVISFNANQVYSANALDDVCLNLGILGDNLSGWPCISIGHKNTCCDRVATVVNSLTTAQIQTIADCGCAQGIKTNTPINAYSAVGIGNYKYCASIGTLINTPAVTQISCKCPSGWLANQTNIDGGITADGKCKKQVCGPFNTNTLPPNGTAVGTWGFTWGNGLWAWGTAANGGAAICTTVVVAPKVCRIQQ